MKRLPQTKDPRAEEEDFGAKEEVWKSGSVEPPITGSGDLLAMMVQGEKALHEEHAEETEERRSEERAPQPQPRKAIISIHGKDVEECEVPEREDKRRVA